MEFSENIDVSSLKIKLVLDNCISSCSSMLSICFSGPLIKKAQEIRFEHQLQSSSAKVEHANFKLKQFHEENQNIPDKTDWAARYSYWSAWEDVDELEETLEIERNKINNLKNADSFMGHNHDHSEERKIFEMNEVDKIKYCEKYRLIGK